METGQPAELEESPQCWLERILLLDRRDWNRCHTLTNTFSDPTAIAEIQQGKIISTMLIFLSACRKQKNGTWVTCVGQVTLKSPSLTDRRPPGLARQFPFWYLSLMETRVPFSSTYGSPRLDIRTETENPKDNCVRSERERGTLCLHLSYVLLLHF